MCQLCETLVGHTGENLDSLLEAERNLRNGAMRQDYSEPQHTMALATRMMETLDEHPHREHGVEEMALALATAVTRLLAAEQIHGIRL